MDSWESLIASAMARHDIVFMCRIEDAKARNRARIARKASRTYYWKHHGEESFKERIRQHSHRYYSKVKDTPEYKEKRRQRQHRQRQTEKYRESHRAYMRAWREKKKLEKMDTEKVINK